MANSRKHSLGSVRQEYEPIDNPMMVPIAIMEAVKLAEVLTPESQALLLPLLQSIEMFILNQPQETAEAMGVRKHG